MNDNEPKEPAAAVMMRAQWTFEVGARDSALILRALGSRLRDDEDRAAASELCDRLTEHRALSAQHMLQSMERAVASMRKAKAATP